MIGERVRHAREFCDLTQTALAQLASVPQSKVSEVESGRDQDPRPEIVGAIARATAFPVSFFYEGPLPDLPDGNFRRLKRGKARATRQVRAQARQVVELVQRAEPILAMPPVRLSPVSEVSDFEEVAAHFREQAGVGYRDPIPNLTRAVERAGVVVVRLPGHIPEHYGFSAWPDFGFDGRPIIAFSGDDPGDRQRFTIAHELGHLLLHSPLRQEELDVDQAESEAHQFAGALLLPREAALETLRGPITLTTLAKVKATYGASIGMCARRALDLGLITPERHVSLRKQLTGRGWHRNEPVEVPNESPLLVSKVLDMLGKGDSLAQRADSVRMPLFAYRALTAAN